MRSNLLAAIEKKNIGVDAIGDGAANERYPVENQGGFLRGSKE